jgi:hypothetical protein
MARIHPGLGVAFGLATSGPAHVANCDVSKPRDVWKVVLTIRHIRVWNNIGSIAPLCVSCSLSYRRSSQTDFGSTTPPSSA